MVAKIDEEVVVTHSVRDGLVTQSRTVARSKTFSDSFTAPRLRFWSLCELILDNLKMYKSMGQSVATVKYSKVVDSC